MIDPPTVLTLLIAPATVLIFMTHINTHLVNHKNPLTTANQNICTTSFYVQSACGAE